MNASMKGHAEVARVLLEHGASQDKFDSYPERQRPFVCLLLYMTKSSFQGVGLDPRV